MKWARRGLRADGVLAILLPIAAILLVSWPIVRGEHGLGPELALDIADPLFGAPEAGLRMRPYDDWSPVELDWPRDKRLLERARQGHFDLWNPLPGNGAPLAPDSGGIFSPLRLIFYAVPGVSAYTAFTLFRLARLFIAALGAYALARSHALSAPASSVVSVAFGFSGGMVSQLPFASVGSVCWLPWVWWAQVKSVRGGGGGSVILHGAFVAAAAVGGHQTIIALVLLGALAHAVGLLVARQSARFRSAALLAAGLALGLLLAAPSIAAVIELLANGHSYKMGRGGRELRVLFTEINRAVLFPGIALPLLLDGVRDRVTASAYPYIIGFTCGLITYLLAAVAAARRMWAPEWVFVLIVGVVLSFEPPGFGWLSSTPYIKDILPRYGWPLIVLPIAMAAGSGLDALVGSARSRRGPPLFARLGRRASDVAWPQGPSALTLVAGVLFYVTAATAIAVFMMWTNTPQIGRAIAAMLRSSPEARLQAALPILAAVALVVAAGLAARLRFRGVRWLLAAAVCVEISMLMRAHLREPASARLRAPPPAAASALAASAAAQHTRVGGQSRVTIALGGFPEVRILSPLVAARYARFLKAAGGQTFATFLNLPRNRSAFADLAAAGYLMVPRTGQPKLEGDPLVMRVAEAGGVTIYQNHGALPRARVVHRTIVAGSIDEAEDQLAMQGRGAAHAASTSLANSAILEPAEDAAPPLLLSGGSASPAEFIVDEPDEVVLRVDCAEPGYLVLADTHYPGWEATVDGRASSIYPANVGFRAVYVGAGRHLVAFRFRPASVRAGLALFAVGVALCAVILLRRMHRSAASR